MIESPTGILRSRPTGRRAAPTALFATALLALTMPPAHAQQEASGRGLPAGIAEQVVQRLNDPLMELREGDVVVPADSAIHDDLVVLEGTLMLRGTVMGEVLIVNGSAVLAPGSQVDEDLVVIGGHIDGDAGGVAGEIATYAQPLPYERIAGRFRLLRGPQIGRIDFDRSGSSDFLITTGKSYNRVEGMPISFGPRLRTAGSNPFQLQALAIYRSEAGFRIDPDQMGYFVRAEQFIGGHREYRVGATLHSLVDPIEEWHLSDLESGLATFLFHRDFRDHYERDGWSVFTAWEPAASPYRIQVESRYESHRTRVSGSPWSLFRNAQEWRPQPVAAAGMLGSVIGQFEFDTRGSVWNPASGLLVRGHLEQAFRVDLRRPELLIELPAGSGGDLLAPRDYGRFITGLIDVRSYNRIDAQSRLNLRVVAGGSLTGDPLPPQRQHALGGEGSLPGFLLFSSDCGARTSRVRMPAERGVEPTSFYPNYGCDAFGLLQAEFRGKLDFRLRWDVGPWREDRDSADVWDFGWAMAPDWAIFVDAGRGWAFDQRRDEDTRVDVGAGILFNRIGAYFAVPLTGGTGVNLFVRLGPRF